ncbi:malate dehydrogenase [Rickettsiales endosymbiont of Paramecium tredecaurelia]|uniref:malate dehydrogenase n=1 Tax=Candidatus Sarmatiella mevalonica TaxID=2770581 RepID=UPI001921BD7E|nr:malate dehydrogenase [Candidatus Sarmatiella mevalonica]MBL3284921.1 malate dehydrogenase [Candidatus Sarmatiella mevalonica]
MHSKPFKISVIGAGNVGATTAMLLMQKGYEVALLDLNYSVAQGKALDLSQMGSESLVYAVKDYSGITGSQVVVVTAGLPRKPGSSREELLKTNGDIIHQVAQQIRQYAPEAFVVVVTNPLDVMAYHMYKSSGIRHQKVVGMAGTLDCRRFNYFLAQATGAAVADIKSTIIGSHGDTMLPLVHHSSIAGISIASLKEMEVISDATLHDVITSTKRGGAQIVELLSAGSAYYAPAASIVEIVDSYLYNQQKILCCSVYVDKQMNCEDVYIGLPVVIGANGVERIMELTLTSDEQKEFANSVAVAKSLINIL